jgi:hypothetical protein
MAKVTVRHPQRLWEDIKIGDLFRWREMILMRIEEYHHMNAMCVAGKHAGKFHSMMPSGTFETGFQFVDLDDVKDMILNYVQMLRETFYESEHPKENMAQREILLDLNDKLMYGD